MTVKYGEMENLVNSVISIDQYKPKIGEASETVVVAFEVFNEKGANDLSNLIETDVTESLDVDTSQGPNNNGNYLVFVEFTRDENLHKNIMEIMKCVSNATQITEWQYEYYKGDTKQDLNEDNLSNTVLDNQQQYVLKYAQQMETVNEENESLDHAVLKSIDIIRRYLDDVEVDGYENLRSDLDDIEEKIHDDIEIMSNENKDLNRVKHLAGL